MRERVLAVLGAVALVVVALVIRSVAFGDDDPGTPGRQRGGAKPVVACTDPLEAVCQALAADGAITAHAPIDLATAADDAPDVDAWIAPAAGPAVLAVDTDSTVADAYQPGPAVFAGSSLSVLSTGAVAQEACGTRQIGTWSCLATSDAAIGVGDPDTAEGLARLAGVVVELPLANEDSSALRRIIESPTAGQQDAAEQATRIVAASGFFDAVVGPSGLLQARAASPRAGGRFVVSDPSPAQSLALVVATSGHHDGAVDLSGALGRPGVRAALTELGYQARSDGSPMSRDLAGKLWQAWKALNR